MKILLLSAYEAQSHLQWRLGLLENLAHHDWTCLTLPPRHFSWRIRGNSLYWSQAQADVLRKEYDLIIATSMVDLSTLRGLVPQFSRIPNLLYFHENQFAYPISKQQHASVEPQIVTLYAALSADQLLFNTQYNLNSFIEGVDTLLNKLPDFVPEGITEGLKQKARVLPVPLSNDWFRADDALNKNANTPNGKPVHELVWNHRWEYDKGPERLLSLVELLPNNLALRWHILGQSFRQQPACFAALHELLRERGWLGHWEYLKDRDQYCNVLRSADTVVSTAIHDFQGLAVLEAMASGCQPLVPDRLAYPEFVPQSCRYQSALDNAQDETKAAVKLLEQRLTNKSQNTKIMAANAQHYSWQKLASAYEECIEKAVIKNS